MKHRSGWWRAVAGDRLPETKWHWFDNDAGMSVCGVQTWAGQKMEHHKGGTPLMVTDFCKICDRMTHPNEIMRRQSGEGR